MRRCLICGAEHATCGPASPIRPADHIQATERAMPVKRYRDEQGNIFSLNEEDAKARGFTLIEEQPLEGSGATFDEASTDFQGKAQKQAANKARATENK